MFAVGEQLPMFVDVGEIADAIADGLIESGDIGAYDDDVHRMFDSKLQEVDDFPEEYSGDLEDTPPSLIGIGIQTMTGLDWERRDVTIEDGHHRLAAWAARGQLAPVLFTDDIDEVYRSMDL